MESIIGTLFPFKPVIGVYGPCAVCTPARITINKSIFVLLQPRWLEDTEYAVISYSIYGCILLVLACVVTALLVVFGNS